MLNRNEYRQMLLAGTVTFPATFPQVGKLELRSENLSVLSGKPDDILTVIETPSSRVTLSRQVLASAVRAVFLPRDPQHVNYSDGLWLLPGEIAMGLKLQLQNNCGPLYGIVFVAESEPTILHMSAGMTAAESVQYYPPLPGDPSFNHYNPNPGQNRTGGPHHRECSSGGECAAGESPESMMFEQAPHGPLFSCS
jgi:hypothetical protein